MCCVCFANDKVVLCYGSFAGSVAQHSLYKACSLSSLGALQVLAAADASELDREEVARQPGASLVLGRRDAWRHAYLQRASDLVDAVRAQTDIAWRALLQWWQAVSLLQQQPPLAASARAQQRRAQQHVGAAACASLSVVQLCSTR